MIMLDAVPRKIPLMPLAGMVIVVIAGLIALLIANGVSSSNWWADHSVQVQTRIVELGERLATHDGALRGYVLTRQPEMAQELRDSREDIARVLTELRNLTRDNLGQQRELNALAPLIAQRLAHGRTLVAERDAKPIEQIGRASCRERVSDTV